MTRGPSRAAPRNPPTTARTTDRPGDVVGRAAAPAGGTLRADRAGDGGGAGRSGIRTGPEGESVGESVGESRGAGEGGSGGVGGAPIVPADRLTAALAAATERAVGSLRRAGLRSGHRVVLDAPAGSRWDVLPFLIAADRLGAAVLVADPGWPVRERACVLADTAPDLVVHTGDPTDAADGVTADGVAADGVAADGAAGDAGSGVVVGAGTGPATAPFLLPTTSGSTGTPTVLARTRTSWRIGFDVLGPLPGPVLTPGPPSSTLYLFGALHALHHGRDLVVRDRFDPADARTAGTVHLVPTLLSALLDDRERRPDGPAPEVVVCGGAHVAPSVRERCARLLPHTRLIEYYGSAEHSLIALRRGTGPAGTPPGGGPLRAVDGVRLELREGLLWVDTPQAVLGRLRGGVLEPTGPGPTTVGDRAGIAADGALTVHGRSASTISSGGTLVAAEEVEQVLRAVPGVADVVVAGTPHPSLGMLVTAVVEPAADAVVSRRDLRAAARAALSPARRPRRWLVTGALPRLGSGKPARAVVDAGLRDGTLDARPLPGGPAPGRAPR